MASAWLRYLIMLGVWHSGVPALIYFQLEIVTSQFLAQVLWRNGSFFIGWERRVPEFWLVKETPNSNTTRLRCKRYILSCPHRHKADRASTPNQVSDRHRGLPEKIQLESSRSMLPAKILELWWRNLQKAVQKVHGFLRSLIWRLLDVGNCVQKSF